MVPVPGKEFPDIQAMIDRRFTLKRLCDMIKRPLKRDNFLLHGSTIRSVWLDG